MSSGSRASSLSTVSRGVCTASALAAPSKSNRKKPEKIRRERN